MIEIDEVEEILDGLASELPKEFYKELNGNRGTKAFLPFTSTSPAKTALF